MISDFEITKCPEHEVKSKMGTIFVNEKILEEYSVRIYEINPYFYEHYRKKIQADENGSECFLFRIGVYFTEYSLAVEIDEKGHTNRDLIFEKKKRIKKKLVLISKNKIKGKSRCAICLTKRSFIDETEYDLESALELYLHNFLLIDIIKNEDLLLQV